MSEPIINEKKVSWYFQQPINFVAGARNLDQIPNLGGFKEFAFVGRSNVGKSSIINALTNRNSLTRVSKNPGCTKQINFFKLADILVLVDLPGYGYAKISASEREHWSRVITKYLQGRRELYRIFLLIDARHGVKNNDLEIMKILDNCGICYQIVFTKLDKISNNELEKLKLEVATLFNKHPALYPELLYTSSNSKQGLEELRYEIIKANYQKAES